MKTDAKRATSEGFFRDYFRTGFLSPAKSLDFYFGLPFKMVDHIQDALSIVRSPQNPPFPIMNIIETLTARNEAFSRTKFRRRLAHVAVPQNDDHCLRRSAGRSIRCSSCSAPGETAVIRNVGGRIFPSNFTNHGHARAGGESAGRRDGSGLEFGLCCITPIAALTVQHTPPKCWRNISASPLQRNWIPSPSTILTSRSRVDVAALKANPQLPDELTVTGLVYDVATGKDRSQWFPRLFSIRKTPLKPPK